MKIKNVVRRKVVNGVFLFINNQENFLKRDKYREDTREKQRERLDFSVRFSLDSKSKTIAEIKISKNDVEIVLGKGKNVYLVPKNVRGVAQPG